MSGLQTEHNCSACCIARAGNLRAPNGYCYWIEKQCPQVKPKEKPCMGTYSVHTLKQNNCLLCDAKTKCRNQSYGRASR